MRSLITYVLLTLSMLCAAAQSPTDSIPQPAPEIRFDSTTVNLGSFKASESPIVHEAHFVNTGTEPLIITKVFSSCGCTVAEFPKEPINPGESGTITIKFDGRGRRHGDFMKILRVRANTPEPITHLYVTGRILREPK